jgi:hypothetical protein
MVGVIELVDSLLLLISIIYLGGSMDDVIERVTYPLLYGIRLKKSGG